MPELTEFIENLRTPTEDNPLRIMFSACLKGQICSYDNQSYMEYYPLIIKLNSLKNVRITGFCPEDFSFGTPRKLSDIHGGNGFDVLDNKAKIISEDGEDWTKEMLRASEKMLKIALENQVELAIMMDISAACGSQVIYKGNRLAEKALYQKGPGLCAAMLIRNGIKVISQRDNKCLNLLIKKLDQNFEEDKEALDMNQTEWYLNYFSD